MPLRTFYRKNQHTYITIRISGQSETSVRLITVDHLMPLPANPADAQSGQQQHDTEAGESSKTDGDVGQDQVQICEHFRLSLRDKSQDKTPAPKIYFLRFQAESV